MKAANKRNGNCLRTKGDEGFTLLELSIVLVIIGLIVGSILVGQDMIKNSEIRATIAQIQKYDSAVNTFHTKYGFIPGDIPSSNASDLGFFNVTGANANTQGYGDGNGMIEYCGGNSIFNTQCGEPLIFWRQLTDGSLVDGNYGTTTSGNALVAGMTGASALTTAVTGGTVNQVIPPAKLGRGNYITMFSASGTNYFEITGISAISTAGALTLTSNMTPLEGFTIDVKIDDGQALTGSIQAMYSTTTLNVSSGTGGVYQCTNNNLWDTITSGPATSQLCQVSIAFN